MNSVKHYLSKLARGVFHKGDTLAVESGIPFGPAVDPKGSFYTDPKVSFYWSQPESLAFMEDRTRDKGLFKGLLVKLGGLRLSA